jgi:CubicO group peptidase (beta-lactamase class C family)
MTRKITSSAALAVFAATVLLSGCGNAVTSSPETPATQATRGTAAVSLPLEYSECMRDHGVPKFPDPVNGRIMLNPASGVDPGSPTVQAAAAACAKYAPPGGSPAAAAAAPTPATWRAFAASLTSAAAAGRFSGAVLVARNGDPVLDAGYGYADRATRAADTPGTRFCIASIGKLFTAVAIGQLAEHGTLAFNAPVGDYLTGLPASIAGHVTIAELLDMTAGLGNTVLAEASPPRTLAGMVAQIARERPQFTPGTRFSYSNDDYILLGAVVQRLSGQSYADYLRQHILDPAGMTRTGYAVYIPARVPGMAHGYAQTGSELTDVSGRPQIANPSGGAYSTTGDLLKFATALVGHKLLTPAMTAEILTPRVNSPQPGGPAVDEYTYGFAYQQINGITFVGHNGGIPGYEGQIDIYPRTGYVAVVLANTDDTMTPVIQRTEAILANS